MSAESQRLTFALRYANECGVPVFPVYGIRDGKCDCGRPDCSSPGKHPLTANGFRDATTDEEQIRKWWERWPPNANIGMPTGPASGYFVLDVDLPDGPANLDALIKQHGAMPDCARSITGSGGDQYFFAYPGEPEIRNSAGVLGQNLDIRGDGGYVILPCSLHASGRRYKWLDASRTLRAIGPVDAPAWLIELAAKPASSKRPDGGAPAEGIREGERNDQLYRLARSLRTKGHTREAVLRMVQAANATECRPPLPESEIQAIVANAFAQLDRDGFAAESAANVWEQAVSAPDFIAQGDQDPDYIIKRLIVPGAITLISGTRGLGKSNIGLALAVTLAKGGNFLGDDLSPARVLLLNRDNPTGTLRRRLKAWGAADAGNLRVMGRDKAPPFTDAEAWGKFPLNRYEAILIDSLSTFIEGVDEKEGGSTGKAIAALLDAAAKSNIVPLILANTNRSGKAFRGSGINADRADIVFEARDATDLKLNPKCDSWIDCLPDPSDSEWAQRAKRRGKRNDYRVALVCSKFRDGDEPDPFIIEVKHDDEAGWSLREVTAEIETAHEKLRQKADAERKENFERAIATLKEALPIRERPEALDLLKNKHDIGRNAARKLIADRVGSDWLLSGKGTKKDPRLLVPVEAGGQNYASANPQGDKDFSQPIPAATGPQGRPESKFKTPAPPRTSEDANAGRPFGNESSQPVMNSANVTKEVRRAVESGDEGLELYPDHEAPPPEDNPPLPTVEEIRFGPDAFVLRRVRQNPTDDNERDS